MEMAGMSAQEIDNMLGHYKIKTALPSYLDQSADAVARRLSKLSEKGGRVLCDAVKSLF
jgi:hypothetical protein